MKRMKWLGGLVWVAGILATSEGAAREPGPSAPHGGRLMTAGPRQVEFHLDKDRKAFLYLYDAGLKPLAVGAGDFTLWVILKTGAKKVPLGVSGTTAASLEALPAHGGYPVVIALKNGTKPLKLRFRLLEDRCGECQFPEYACVCGHESP